MHKHCAALKLTNYQNFRSKSRKTAAGIKNWLSPIRSFRDEVRLLRLLSIGRMTEDK
jgi:hypothetical protein